MVRIDKVDDHGIVVKSEIGVELLSEALQLSKDACKAQFEEPYEGKWLKHAISQIRYLEILDEVRQMEVCDKHKRECWDEVDHMVEIDGKAYCFSVENFGCYSSDQFHFSEFKKSANMVFDEDYIWR